MNNILITSIVLALISCVILKNAFKFDNNQTNLITIAVVIGFIFWKKFNNIEKMTVEAPEEEIIDDCNIGPEGPIEYTLDHIEEDTGNTGLVFNNNMPGYYLLNDNYYSNDGISYDKAMSMIQNSKYNDLLEQHNYNIIWSPHTHVGKNRGYMNWNNNY